MYVFLYLYLYILYSYMFFKSYYFSDSYMRFIVNNVFLYLELFMIILNRVTVFDRWNIFKY